MAFESSILGFPYQERLRAAKRFGLKRLGMALLAALLSLWVWEADAQEKRWSREWPRTDFSKHSVPLSQIKSVVPKDAIPAIDRPRFMPAAEAKHLKDTEPVIGLVIDGEAKAYPLQVLIWHEIANDVVGGTPVAVTYCPLCNSAVVFDRRIGGRTLSFGVSGKLRNSDLVMYDRQTSSWWQQFTGEAMVGALTGAALKILPARLESFALFRARAPLGKVMMPSDPAIRPYGENPYKRYDSSPWPFLYNGSEPRSVGPLERVVSVEGQAWSLRLLRKRKKIETPGGLIVTWLPGQNSALDTKKIARGYDVGNVTVQRRSETGLVDIPYGIDFAFAFHAFHPDAKIITK